jgi:glyoxylase-like metal-dependent hydrolase (beta-lactamase superfamily II)
MSGTAQAPGFYRTRVGGIGVTVLNDGDMPSALGALNGIRTDAARSLFDAAFRPAEPRTAVNVFAIETGGKLLVVDAGYGPRAPGPWLGHLPRNLAAAGIEPAAVDVVLLTHMHPDHAFGLATAEAGALFPNAQLVMHPSEHEFWLHDESAGLPERVRQLRPTLAAITAPYAERLRLMAEGEVLPGVHLRPLPGHTPGHCGVQIESGRDSLLLWADITHMHDVQLPRPEVTIGFDVDPEAAIATRWRLLDEVATDRLRVAGSHTHFPALGHVAREGSGYRFVPEAWQAS